MTTLRDIALKAGVSTATVSNVLNDALPVSPELRRRVMAAAQQLKYRPNTLARGLRLRQSRTVGMIVPDITNPFFPAVVRGAEDVLTKAGYTLIIGNSDNDTAKEDDYYHTFIERQVDGLLTVPTSEKAPAALARLQERGTPIVYVDRMYPGILADAVLADNAGGSEQCVRCLGGLGHKRIAIITGPLKLPNAQDRLTGYRRALKALRLKESKALIRQGAFDRPSGVARMQELLALAKPPDAVFASNALMACGALEAMHAAGCAERIALACFDRLDFFDLLRPRIVCYAAPCYELGAQGAERLLQRLSGKAKGQGVRSVLEGRLLG